MLKETEDLDILGEILDSSIEHFILMTFDSKMIFEKNLHSVSRAASQRLGVLMKSR